MSIMRENDEKLKEILNSEEVPEQLSPENIKLMLDEKAPKKKRSGISIAGRIAAGAAACAVLAGSYAGVNTLMKNRTSTDDTSIVSFKKEVEAVNLEAPYMSGAESYSDVYQLMKKASDDWNKEQKKRDKEYYFTNGDMVKQESAVAEAAVESADEEYNGYAKGSSFDDSIAGTETTAGGIGGDEEQEHSDTYNQEEGVLEADIVKTDGNNIYYIWNDWSKYNYYDEEVPYSSRRNSGATMDVATVKNGKFTDKKTLDLTPDLSGIADDKMEVHAQVSEMYLYNDMIEVIGTVNGYPVYDDDDYDSYEASRYIDQTFVSFYTKGDDPELIGTYFQDGFFSDVRISPEGYMYIISNYNTVSFDAVEDEENIERYIPTCGIDEVTCIPAEDILMPNCEPTPKTLLSYNVITSIDLNNSGSFEIADTKALAGFSGSLYSSAENMYIASGWEDTDITRISIAGGSITPVASGKVEGYVLNQFSMSEYNGYFRVATTVDKWNDGGRSWFSSIFNGDSEDVAEREHHNNVYVLDMDMNIVGKVTGFGKDESVKSVNFSGDMGYVVTYEQTDPLFAIDLSDPAEPFITDKFKINGFSTYMQKWTDGLLLGFGINADDNGIQTGVKMVMFDNSDPYNLKEVGFEALDQSGDEWISSSAVYDRKALLIAPEKNIIGFPVEIDRYCYDEVEEYHNQNEYKFVFYSYNDGKFEKIGEINAEDEEGTYIDNVYNRAVYIGNYVYVTSGKSFASLDMNDFSVVDTVDF